MWYHNDLFVRGPLPQKQPQNESNPAFGFALEFQVVQAVPNSA